MQRNRLSPSEHGEQRQLVRWASVFAKKYPALDLLFAIPNGGNRNAITGSLLKAEGVKPGVPDLCLPVPSKDHHGLFIELKRESARPKRAGKGGVSNAQRWWLDSLADQGFRTEVCYGAKHAIEIIEDYLK
ncbi:MAG: VRR-NUC domain-containing protein [Pseudomonadota bacterium]|nr:VRR-NUC domain-containing protein [Pseudomonadota bacterium]